METEPETPLLRFRMVRVDVVQTGERKDRHPDALACDVGGGLLLALHGTKRALAFLPGVTYEDLLDQTRAEVAAEEVVS